MGAAGIELGGKTSTVIWFRITGAELGVLGEGSRCCLQSLLTFRFCSLHTMGIF
jgi:hypothetical protein